MKPLLATVAVVSSLTLLTLGGCATTPKPAYIPVNTYQGYDCYQLQTEYNRVSQYLNANQNPSGLVMSGVGIGVGIGRGGVYPNVNIGIGQANGGNRSNVAIALGQRDALIQAARLKQCAFANGLKLFQEA